MPTFLKLLNFTNHLVRQNGKGYHLYKKTKSDFSVKRFLHAKLTSYETHLQSFHQE